MKIDPCLLSLLFGAFAVPALAQSPAPALLAKPALKGDVPAAIQAGRAWRDASQVWFDAPGDGSIWVRGAGYKAGFTRESAAVIPALGPTVESRPLSMSPASLTIAGTAVAFDMHAPPAREGTSVVYERGGFLERYDATPDAIEQSFVFESLPARGELVLRMSAESVLSARETGEGLRFESEEGGLEYSRAVAVDALGRRETLATRLAAGGIEIRVPAAFLASATLPLVIDPIMTVFAVNASSSDDHAPDAAYDRTNDTWLVCSEQDYSSTDHDVFEALVDSSGALIHFDWIDLTGADWRRPRCANNNAANQFMVVANVGSAPTRSVRSRTVDAATNAFGSQTPITSPAPGTELANPVIGGDQAASGTTFYLVVAEYGASAGAQRAIVQMLMGTDGLPNSGIPGCIDCGAGEINVLPSISKNAGQGPGLDHRWNVAWQYEYSPTDHDVYGAQMVDAVLVTPPFAIDSTTLDDHAPSVSSFLDRSAAPADWVTTYERHTLVDSDIQARVLNGSTVIASGDLSALEGPAYVGQRQVGASVDTDGLAFVVAYSELFGTSTTDYDLYVSTFNRTGGTIAPIEVHQALSFGGWPDVDVQVTASRGTPDRPYFAVWAETAPADGDITAAFYGVQPIVSFCAPGVDTTASCPCANQPGLPGNGCNNSVGTGGAYLHASGDASVSADTLTLVQTGELPTSMSVFLQGDLGNPAGVVFGGGVRCTAGNLKRLFVRPASGGSVAVPQIGDLSISTISGILGSPITAGASRFYQVYYRDPNLQFCSAGFNVGSGIRTIWSP
jgi:hypothetical protein